MSLTLNKSLKDLSLDKNINNDSLYNNFKYNTLQINKSNSLYSKNNNILSSNITRNLLKNYSVFNFSSKESIDKIYNSEIHKLEKEIIDKNKNYSYMNKGDSKKEAGKLYNLHQENQKKFSLNKIFNNTFSGFINILNKYNPKTENEMINDYQLKKFYYKYVRKGLFGKKNKDNLPLNFPLVSTSLNKYASKSEKERHEKLLNEFGKLEYYLKLYPKNKLKIIKDFLIKYQITELNQYSNEQLLNIENFVKHFAILLEPYKNVKSMLIDILEGKIKSNNNNNKKIYISPYYVDWGKKLDESKENKIDYYKNFDLIKQKKLYVKEKDYSKNFQDIINDVQIDINKKKERNLSEIQKENQNHNQKFNFVTSLKKPHPIESLNIVLTSKKKKIKKIILQKSNSQGKFSISKITNRLYYNRIQRPLDMTQIQKNKKITEFAALNIAKNNILIKNLTKENL